MKPMLRLEGLRKSFGRLRVTDEVSFEIQPQEIAAIIGPNGAGKTTTFRTLAGLTLCKIGSIMFKGKNCTRFPPFKMARMGLGFVPEDRRILGPLTVL